MNKPEIGDTLVLKPSNSMPLRGQVVAVFNDLDESWDPWGESAWAQSDVDKMSGQQGEWYAILETDDPIDGTWSVGSYEVERIVEASESN